MSSFPIASLIVALLVLGAVLLVQPLLLKLSATACGEKSPSLWTAIAALLASAVACTLTGVMYGLSLGVLLGGVSRTLAGLGAWAVSYGTTAIVFSAFLRVSVTRGAVIAIVHHVLSGLLAAILGFALHAVAL